MIAQDIYLLEDKNALQKCTLNLTIHLYLDFLRKHNFHVCIKNNKAQSFYYF
jgi:hypothetical protein